MTISSPKKVKRKKKLNIQERTTHIKVQKQDDLEIMILTINHYPEDQETI